MALNNLFVLMCR